MATNTYVALQTQTLGSAVSSVTFTGIDQTYTDLVIEIVAKNPTVLDSLGLQFNTDTTSNYSNTILGGNGSSASSARQTNQTELNIGLTSTNDSFNTINIMNYSNSTTYKTVISRPNTPAELVRAVAATWRSTAAITSILVKNGSGYNFTTGSTFTIYGIKCA